MKRVNNIRAIGRNFLLVGMALMILAPQAHTVCFRDCAELEQPLPACSCHTDVPSCCLTEESKPLTPIGCGCEECIEVQLPDSYCSVAELPQLKRFWDTETPPLELISSLPAHQITDRTPISPLDLENRFTSQIDDQLTSTVIIS